MTTQEFAECTRMTRAFLGMMGNKDRKMFFNYMSQHFCFKCGEDLNYCGRCICNLNPKPNEPIDSELD